MDESPPSTRGNVAGAAGSSPIPPLPPPKPRRKFPVGLFVVGVIFIILAVVGTFYYLHNVAPFESTDDAFVEGNVTFISPRVPGLVIKLLVNDNQRVKAGDPIIEIDPSDYETTVAQAQADIATAKANVTAAEAKIEVDLARIEQQKAGIVAAKANAEQARADRARYEAVTTNAISRSQLDLARTQASSTEAQVAVAESEQKAAEAQLAPDRAAIEAAKAQVQQGEARLKQAQLNLSYTKVAAPRDGRVTQRSVQQGAYVQAGQALLALVPDEVWVVANFKETQLTGIRVGQPVALRVDAYPQKEFRGKVDSLQAGSGARFSLLPPENAVGNYVKVVQRVPVKIVFDEAIDATQFDIAPGMSVTPKVRVK